MFILFMVILIFKPQLQNKQKKIASWHYGRLNSPYLVLPLEMQSALKINLLSLHTTLFSLA